jgi:hypothetical protein
MSILIGNLTNVFGSFSQPGAVGLTPPVSVEEFNAEIHRLALIMVYIGISVFVAGYIGTVCWIITGERISRRIRMFCQLHI